MKNACVLCGKPRTWTRYGTRCATCAQSTIAAGKGMTLKEYQRDNNLRVKYGIGVREYDEMALAQSGACAACGQKAKRLVVDHCHTHGNVRGLLCDRCNVAMHTVDQPDLLNKLIDYRDRHAKGVAA